MATLNNNSSPNISASTFFSELMKISTDIVWKNQTLANRCENIDNYIEVEMFIAANRGIITFDSIHQFDYETLIGSGLTQEQALSGMDEKESIPKAYRKICIDKYVSRLLATDPRTGRYINYEEKNNYYRMLYGLPDYDDTDFIYNTVYSDVSKVVPLHELSIQERYLLESRGYLSTVIKANPTKKYLSHLTGKCISPYVSRSSERYSILWMHDSDYDNMISDFKKVYNDCRYSILRVYYTDAFKKDNPEYEGFLAMCVLFMTIQLMHYKYLDVDITRDFYDLESIRYIYDSYGVPFYSSLPLKYHKKIVKNINRLLSYKGSTRVFFDLFQLFDYGSIDVHEYYLLRTHKFVNGKPMFVKKEDGTYDYREMYDIKFAQVRLYDNPPMEISDSRNHLDYNAMTILDPFWVSDEELLNKLYSTEFNYLETKYIGIQTLFDMVKIMYESTYFFKMLLDNKSIVSQVSLYLSTIPKNVDLFSMIVYVCALICRKFGYQGTISTSLPIVSKILGFNFKQDLAAVRDSILNDPKMRTDTELLDLLISMDINSIASINSTFEKISDLRKLLVIRKNEARSREEFYAYYNLERTLMTTDFIEEVYTKSNGIVAESFSDLLLDVDSELYVRLISNSLDIDYELEVILASLSQAFNNLHYIEYAAGNDIVSVIEHLFKLLNFFKSAKSELTGYNIVYTLSARGVNMLKFLDEINLIKTKETRNDSIRYLTDLIEKSTSLYKVKGTLELSLNGKDKIVSETHRRLIKDEIQTLEDMISIATQKIYLDSKENNIELHDIIKSAIIKTTLKSYMPFHDQQKLLSEKVEYVLHVQYVKDILQTITDSIKDIFQLYHVDDKAFNIPISDQIEIFSTVTTLYRASRENNLEMSDTVAIASFKEVVDSKLLLHDTNKLISERLETTIQTQTMKDKFESFMETVRNISSKYYTKDSSLSDLSDGISLSNFSIISKDKEFSNIDDIISSVKTINRIYQKMLFGDDLVSVTKVSSSLVESIPFSDANTSRLFKPRVLTPMVFTDTLKLVYEIVTPEIIGPPEVELIWNE